MQDDAADIAAFLVPAMRGLLDFVPVPLMISIREDASDGSSQPLHVNKAFREQIGYASDELPPLEDWLRLAPADPACGGNPLQCLNEAMRRHHAKGPCGLAQLEVLVRCRSGEERWFVATMEQDGATPPELSVFAFRDVHELKASLHRTIQLARTDVVTGLLNRYAGEELLEHAWRDWQDHGRGFSLMLCDIDWLKRINDVHGHNAGDAALRLAAECLEREIRCQDRAVRWGGDEFMLLLPGADKAIAAQIAERLRASVESRALRWQNAEIGLSVSIGCVSTRVFDSRENLLIAADMALYQAKRDGRNRVCSPHEPGWRGA